MRIVDIFSGSGPLAKCLPSYQPRNGQIGMAEAVDAVLAGLLRTETDDVVQVLVVEAETGIGKSLAYLIPAILSGKRIVISTATLNLQDQLIEKDIPLVEKALARDLKVLCLKGRENYLCLYRWFQYRSNPQLSIVEEPWLEGIDGWLKKTEIGDRAELDWLGEQNGIWHKISSLSSHCLGADCPEGASCFLQRIRQKAGRAQIIVVNHHLFFSDLALKKSGYGEILPRYEAVIFDEAHHLENVATTFFGMQVSQYQFTDLFNDLERLSISELNAQHVDRLLPLISRGKLRVERLCQLVPAAKGRYYFFDLLETLGVNVWRTELDAVTSSCEALLDDLEDLEKYGDAWRAAGKRLRELHDKLRNIGVAYERDQDHKNVYWYEKRERNVVFSSSPIEVATHLREHLYQQVESCVITSATLSSGGTFDYIRDRLGLSAETAYLEFQSPFDYKNQTLLYVVEENFPEPSQREYTAAACERILRLLQCSRGRALVLCTSYSGMNAIAQFLEGKIDYPLLKQGSGSRHALLRRFREETESVLIAVASFWEGVDIVGEALSCVIIDKLPFEVPSDPVVQARIAMIKEAGGNPFYDFQVPRAILALRQGVGRLLRSADDRGLVAILDVRILRKNYGKRFMKSLPPSPCTTNIAEVENFFKQ